MPQQPMCPQLHLWRQIYTSLTEARDQAGDTTIPMPPQVFNMQGWLLSTDTNKHNRWTATVAWAADYGFGHVIPDLTDHDWYDGKD
jgi:hypothetical protein